MKKFTTEDIRSWKPCYDPIKYIPEDWSGTVIDILKNDDIPFKDRLWVVLRTELLSDKIMRLFAVWSYRQTFKFITNQDPRSIEAADVAERFAYGEATKEQLSAAYSAALSAAYSAALSAFSAALSAAYSAALSSAFSAYSAALSAAYSAAYSASRSAYSASRSAESAQRDKLIEMILIEEKGK